jgi:hypothetical protein
MNKKNVAVLLSGLLLFNLSCKEALPPRTEPAEVLVGTMHVGGMDTVEVIHRIVEDTPGRYIHKYEVQSSFSLKITLQNVYDDLLQGRAKIDGKVVIQSFGNIPNIIIAPITLGNLRNPAVFRGDVALPPGKSAEYFVGWNPVGTNAKPAYDGSPYVLLDSAQLYGPIEFIASAEVSLFERVQPIKIPGYRFTLLFKEYVR